MALNIPIKQINNFWSTIDPSLTFTRSKYNNPVDMGAGKIGHMFFDAMFEIERPNVNRLEWGQNKISIKNHNIAVSIGLIKQPLRIK